jgi:parvulin-like peptidyl-prolyl isomerase
MPKTTKPKKSPKKTTKSVKKLVVKKQKNLLIEKLNLVKDKVSFSAKPWMLVIIVLLLLAFMFRNKLIVATVNGQPITRFALIKELEKAAGRQTLDSLVTQSLVYQEARKQGVEVSTQELDEEISKIEENITSQGQDLDTLLQAQGMSRSELREQIKIQKIVEKIVGQDVIVSEEELASYMEENADFMPEDVDEVEYKEQVRAQLTQQQVGEKIQTWLQELRGNANVKLKMFE